MTHVYLNYKYTSYRPTATLTISYYRGGGSNFTLVRQNLWTLLNVWKNVATHIYTQATYNVATHIYTQATYNVATHIYTQATCTAQSIISMQAY